MTIKITHWDIDSTKMTLKDKQKFHEYLIQQDEVNELLEDIKKELRNVAGDFLISSGELSKQEYAKYLLEKLEA